MAVADAEYPEVVSEAVFGLDFDESVVALSVLGQCVGLLGDHESLFWQRQLANLNQAQVGNRLPGYAFDSLAPCHFMCG